MPTFSKSSSDKLSTCHYDLQKLFDKIIENYDCTIIEGNRSIERQQELYNEGKSKIDGTNKKGKHNYEPSFAIDVSPFPIDWCDRERFYHFAGYVKGIADSMGIKIRWGGDWDSDNSFNDQSFDDLPHFELD